MRTWENPNTDAHGTFEACSLLEAFKVGISKPAYLGQCCILCGESVDLLVKLIELMQELRTDSCQTRHLVMRMAFSDPSLSEYYTAIR